MDLIQNELDFLNSVVTEDESWMFNYDPELKKQSGEWHTKSSSHPKEVRMSKSHIKTMLIVFFDPKESSISSLHHSNKLSTQPFT